MSTEQVYPKVAIVIVNWNKKEYVLNLLNSLQRLNYPDYDIIIVDNASTDGSVEAIRQAFNNVEILVNQQNLGGTGGFNTGMRYALNKSKYKYIWLLDNDAEIEHNTLIELVKVMEKDEKIGIAGSRIIDKDTNVTVECGSYIRKDTIGVTPYYRNLKTIPSYECIDVDYVAVCSALVRSNALSTVGLMDARFFLFWDDIDWGWTFKDKGYRVIAVPNSIVFHPSFTERDRGLLTNFYYGIRNSLLTYGKHLPLIQIAKVFYNYNRHFWKGTIFLFISGEKVKVITSLTAIRDFFKGRWGDFTKLNDFNYKSPFGGNQNRLGITRLFGNKKRILVIGLGASKEEIFKLRGELHPFGSEITLLITDDRHEIYKDYFEKIVRFNSQKGQSLIYNIKLFIALILSHYDITVSTTFNPFLLISRRRLIFKDSAFYEVKKKINLLVVFVSTLFGELTALLSTPFLVIRAMRWKKSTS